MDDRGVPQERQDSGRGVIHRLVPRGLAGCALLLALLLAGGGAGAQSARQQRFDALIAEGWQAHGKDWAHLEKCFLAAQALGVRPLKEEEVRAISFGRRVRGDLAGSVEAAAYDYRYYPGRASIEEYAAALIAAHDYKAARAAFADWDRRGKPGYNARENNQNLDRLREEAAIRYRAYHISIDEKLFPKDIQRSYRQVGGWDYPFPDGDKWHEARFLLKNVARHEERVDGAGNRWVRLFPEDMDAPVQLTILWKAVPDFVDLSRLPDVPYTVPEKYRPYLGKTEDCDPTSAVCKEAAGRINARTTAEKVRAVWEWQNHVTYGGRERLPGEPNSDATIRTNKGVCLDQAEGAAALSRALGLAARHVRGHGHSWVETWVPDVGWLPSQQYVDLGRTEWNVLRFLSEPVDETTHSPLLDWKTADGRPMATNFYIAQFLDFYLWGLDQHNEHLEKVLYTMEDQPIDDVARRLVPAWGPILKTDKWE